ncbi:sigma-70 family RNA polymerase sigma factor [Actinocrispum wychmicini]|uniref:RNA polymerase sigma factor n=1 Tax=Actinocrispum wychmicini TaxID=1213861 RepID=A0A4R2JKP1_9PSEU|nr:sigma-70 family RNA polymerase sigma factor [Actinocrispum wychmicini]TCO60603.1 RNA polymerase sigma-70 factor (ECF subfamily) [Actinocrispum wychmicini]
MSRSRTSDDEITRWAFAARRGDRAALERFVRATQHDVWRYAAHLADTQLADDLTQETYLRALSSLVRFEGRSSARTWLLSIARRVVVDHIRAKQARPRRADVADWQAAAEQAQPSPTRFEEGVVIGELIRALDDDRREAFVLTQALGLSYAEAAEICDCPVGTIRSRVARARDDLISSMHETDRPRGRRSAI